MVKSRTYFFVIICLFVSIAASSDSNQSTKGLLIEIASLRDSVKSYQQQLVEIKNETDLNSKILDQRIQQASTTIGAQDSRLNYVSALYTVVAVLVSVLLFSQIAYFLVIARKSNGIVRKAETSINAAEKRIKSLSSKKAIDKRVSKSLEADFNKKFDLNIYYLLEPKDESFQTDAIEHLRICLKSPEYFTTEQLLRLISVFKNSRFQHPNRLNLIIALAARKPSLPADDYFQTHALYDKDNKVLGTALLYFRHDYSKYSPAIVEYFDKSGKPKDQAFIELLTRMPSTLPNYIPDLINDKTIFDSLSSQETENVIHELKDNKYDAIREEINVSYFLKTKKLNN